MWQSRMVKLLRASCELSLREPFFAQQHRSMAVTSAMQPHMRQAVMDITQRIGSVDLVIEMRDARIPQTSANYNLINLIRGKPKRLLLLNKADLAHKRFRKVLQYLMISRVASCMMCDRPEQCQNMLAGNVARARIFKPKGIVHQHGFTRLCCRSAGSGSHMSAGGRKRA